MRDRKGDYSLSRISVRAIGVLRCRAKPATTWRFDDKGVAGPCARAVGAAHFDARTVCPLQPVPARRGVFTSCQPVGRNDPAVGEDHDIHILQELHPAPDTIAPAMLARATRAFTDFKALQQDRKPPFQNLRIRQA